MNPASPFGSMTPCLQALRFCASACAPKKAKTSTVAMLRAAIMAGFRGLVSRSRPYLAFAALTFLTFQNDLAPKKEVDRRRKETWMCGHKFDSAVAISRALQCDSIARPGILKDLAAPDLVSSRDSKIGHAGGSYRLFEPILFSL